MEQYTQQIQKNLTQPEIKNLKDKFSNKEIISLEEMKKIKKLNNYISNNNANLAKLFIRTYDICSNAIKQENVEETEFLIKFDKYLRSIKGTEELRELIIRYTDGSSFGDHFIELDIEDLIKENGKSYREFIGIFFSILGDSI